MLDKESRSSAPKHCAIWQRRRIHSSKGAFWTWQRGTKVIIAPRPGKRLSTYNFPTKAMIQNDDKSWRKRGVGNVSLMTRSICRTGNGCRPLHNRPPKEGSRAAGMVEDYANDLREILKKLVDTSIETCAWELALVETVNSTLPVPPTAPNTGRKPSHWVGGLGVLCTGAVLIAVCSFAVCYLACLVWRRARAQSHRGTIVACACIHGVTKPQIRGRTSRRRLARQMHAPRAPFYAIGEAHGILLPGSRGSSAFPSSE